MMDFLQTLGRSSADDYTDGKLSSVLTDFPMESKIEPEASLETAQSDDNAVLAKSFQSLWEKEDRIYAPYGVKAEVGWDLYHSTYASLEGKDDWQSDMRLPLYMISVERMVSMLMQMFDFTPNWFVTTSLVPQHQVYHNIARRFTRYRLEEESVQFKTKARHAFQSGAITGQMTVLVNQVKGRVQLFGQDDVGVTDPSLFGSMEEDDRFNPNPEVPKLSLEILPSSDVRLDSTGLKRYVMWQRRVPASYLYDIGEESGYDMDAVRRALKRAGTTDKGRSRAIRKAEADYGFSDTPEDPQSELLVRFLEGDLPAHDGTGLLFKDKFMIVAENEVIYGPAPIPWWHGEKAVISAPFISFTGSVYGKSSLTEAADGFMININTINQMLDYCYQVVYGTWEVDKARLDQEQQRFDIKVYPGAVFHVEGEGGQPAVRRVAVPSPDAGWWQHYDVFRMTIENSTGMSNQLGGATNKRGRMTAPEFQTRIADGGALFKTWFEDLERNFFSPLIRQVYLNGLQFTPQEVWKEWVMGEKISLLPDPKTMPPEDYQKWSQALDEMADWSPEERYKNLGGQFRFVVKMISALVERQAQIERITTVFKTFMGLGPSAMPALNMKYLLSELITAVGLDPERALNLAMLEQPWQSGGVDTQPEAMSQFPGMEDGEEDDSSGLSLVNNVLKGMQSQGNMRPGAIGGPNPMTNFPNLPGGFGG